MKGHNWLWQLVGFTATSLGGTLLHFLYDWLGGSAWIAPFSGVNESTWEHMKLLFWPMFIFAIAQSFFCKDYADFWCVKLRSTLLGLILIPIIFYTYNGAIGKSPDWINIAIFFVSAAVAYFYEARRPGVGDERGKYPRLALFALCAIGVMFIVFSFLPPELELFRDPITQNFGR